MFRAVAGIGVRRTLVSLAAVIAVAAAACGGSSGGGNDNGGDQPPATNVSLRSSASLGNYLVSADGRTSTTSP
jgi:hypothetical protein